MKTTVCSSLVALLLLTGCATTPEPRGNPDLLKFLEDGRTTRTQVISALGQPSGRFEDDNILTYRLAFTPANNGYLIVEREVTNSGWPLWTRADYSLVLVFDGGSVLTRHSLVRVGKSSSKPISQ